MEETLILHHFADTDLEGFCLDSLKGFRTKPFTTDLFGDANLVLSDRGIPGSEFPGFVPVILLLSDEDDYPSAYFTREADAALTSEQLLEEVKYVSRQASIGREMMLQDKQILNSAIIDELVRMGGKELIVKGLREFIRNATLQLNECISLLGRKDFQDIRFILHALKGNGATLGAEQLAAAIGGMEAAIESENYTNFDEKLKLAYTLLTSFNFVSGSWQQE